MVLVLSARCPRATSIHRSESAGYLRKNFGNLMEMVAPQRLSMVILHVLLCITVAHAMAQQRSLDSVE